MMRSFGYAAYAALFAFTVHAPDDYGPLEPWAGTWEHWAADAFLNGYLAALGDAALLPRDAAARRTLLAAFTLDKALYELGHELDHRPDWVRIPLLRRYPTTASRARRATMRRSSRYRWRRSRAKKTSACARITGTSSAAADTAWTSRIGWKLNGN